MKYATGAVDPRPLVAATVSLERVGDALGGWRPHDAGPGPKIHIAWVETVFPKQVSMP